jgi:Tol biopolymer transport system component
VLSASQHLSEWSVPEQLRVAVSPDGHRIAVNYGTAVGLFDPSGRWRRTVSITGGSDGRISWAPDGQLLVIERLRATPPDDYRTDTYLLSFEGQQRAFLRDATDVQWNRAGGVAFVRYNSRLRQDDLYVAETKGTHARRLTRRGADGPDWSPDGRRIAFTRHDPVFSLWMIDRDGRHARRLTAPYGAEDPAWSPDGKSIAYVTSADTLSPGSYPGGVYIIDLASRHVRRIAQRTGEFVPALNWQSLPK